MKNMTMKQLEKLLNKVWDDSKKEKDLIIFTDAKGNQTGMEWREHKTIIKNKGKL